MIAWRWSLAVPSRKIVECFLFLSLLQAIDGVMSWDLCPRVVSQAPQHFRSSVTQAICDGCFTRQVFLPSHLLWLRNAQDSNASTKKVMGLRKSIWNIVTCQSGLPPHFNSSLNLWECYGVRVSDYHLSRQTSGELVWLLPSPSSSWRSRPCCLHCLRGRWKHLA